MSDNAFEFVQKIRRVLTVLMWLWGFGAVALYVFAWIKGFDPYGQFWGFFFFGAGPVFLLIFFRWLLPSRK